VPEGPSRETASYAYELPAGRIAREPAEPRDASRLMVLRADGIAHERFSAFPDLLGAGDVLVVNETRVLRARLIGRREPGGGRAEILLLRPANGAAYDTNVRRWLALARPGRKLTTGTRVSFDGGAFADVIAELADGVREVELTIEETLDTFLGRAGELPLPTYVGAGNEDRASRYQTVFARVPGSVAAPTASLHFTDATFARLRERAVTIVPIVLDVGLGTFRPIEAKRIDDHVMHAERFEISPDAAEAIESARVSGRRIVAAGTTVVRALESAGARGRIASGSHETNLFVTPGFRFTVVDALLTNFHLPASSLLVLVSAFAGYERTMRAYATAVAEGYRFYSFGDAMFVDSRAN
jgi:S-adenosylmethionine:tRNA ribosyltransferase-isomerase